MLRAITNPSTWAASPFSISAFATVWTYDIYKPMIKANGDDAHYVKVGRWSTILGVLVSIGTAQQSLGKPKPALASLDRALRIVEAGTDPVEKALGRFSVARALIKLDKTRANNLATAAHEALTKAGPDHASEDHEVMAWLDEHY